MTTAADYLDNLTKAEHSFLSEKLGKDTNLAPLQKARESLNLPDSSTTQEQTALWIMAPCLAAFALWIHKKAKEKQQPMLLGVMREGRLLSQLMVELFGYPHRELWLNRDVSLRAAFSAGDDEALLNWLVRTRQHPLSANQASEIFFNKEGANFPNPEAPLTAHTAEGLIQQWHANGNLQNLREQESETRKRFLMHWDDVTQEAKGDIFLMDFAHSGNIQRSLRTLLLSEKREDRTYGINFLTTPGVKWAKQTGTKLSGFLADAGSPSWIADPYSRTPELIEIFTALPIGPLQSFSASGQPLLGQGTKNPEQKEWAQSIHPELVKAAKHYLHHLDSSLTSDLARLIWGRFLMSPFLCEANAFADWVIDNGIDGLSTGRLIPKTQNEENSRLLVPWPAGSHLFK